jgi:acylphosphatase
MHRHAKVAYRLRRRLQMRLEKLVSRAAMAVIQGALAFSVRSRIPPGYGTRMHTMPTARSIHITGHVQGVFFREWAVQLANELGITGWVRNRQDGSVEVYAIGQADQIDRFVTQLSLGSPAARVDAIQAEPAELESLSGFVRRATV